MKLTNFEEKKTKKKPQPQILPSQTQTVVFQSTKTPNLKSTLQTPQPKTYSQNTSSPSPSLPQSAPLPSTTKQLSNPLQQSQQDSNGKMPSSTQNLPSLLSKTQIPQQQTPPSIQDDPLIEASPFPSPKLGRPVNPNSARQKHFQRKKEKEQAITKSKAKSNEYSVLKTSEDFKKVLATPSFEGFGLMTKILGEFLDDKKSENQIMDSYLFEDKGNYTSIMNR